LLHRKGLEPGGVRREMKVLWVPVVKVSSDDGIKDKKRRRRYE